MIVTGTFLVQWAMGLGLGFDFMKTVHHQIHHQVVQKQLFHSFTVLFFFILSFFHSFSFFHCFDLSFFHCFHVHPIGTPVDIFGGPMSFLGFAEKRRRSTQSKTPHVLRAVDQSPRFIYLPT